VKIRRAIFFKKGKYIASMINNNYKNLLFFQEIMVIIPIIYEYTKYYPKSEQGFTGIVSQLRRASISVASNIAEGSSRDEKEFYRFLKIALGSLREVETQIQISKNLKFIDEKQFNEINEQISKCLGKMTKYMKYVRKTAFEIEEKRFEKIRKTYGKK